MTTFTATYSAEDNKLRLYAEEWLEKELYQRLKDSGFKYAKHQELFVAPKWTPEREDLCIELAGRITAEQTTLVERAKEKAKRLDHLAKKREYQANVFFAAANKLSQRFSGGQPILVGHHSERSARRDQERIHRSLDNGAKALKSIEYWQYRATGVERHANRKNNDRVRARRIKTLLADLRAQQRQINHAHICVTLWENIKAESDPTQRAKLAEYYAGAQLKTGSAAPYYSDQSLWYHLKQDSMTPEAVIDVCLDFHNKNTNSQYTARWIHHILNRLAFERSELGEIERCSSPLTATILQAFLREHGAHKPKAKQHDGQWQVTSDVPLPLHIGEGKTLRLTTEQWYDLMQASGYEAPTPTPKQPPLLNIKASAIQVHIWGGIQALQQIPLTKAKYSAIPADNKGVKRSACGQFRTKICKHPDHSGYASPWCTVFLVDAKESGTIDSDAIIDPITDQQEEN